MKQKQGIRLLGGAILFTLLAVAVVAGANYVTRPFQAKADKVEKTLYSDDTDMEQTEIVLLGGSHANNGFNPTVMWREERIKAYNFSFSGEPVYLSYYYLKELFKKRHPKLVVFDLYYIGLDNQYFSRDSYVFEVLSNIRWSRDKLTFIRNCVSPEERARYYFPLITYHSRWQELTQADFLRKLNPDNDFWLGSDYHFERNAGEVVSFEPREDTGEVTAMPENSEKYLRMLTKLVQENQCELLFVALPHRYNDASAPDKWVENEYPVYAYARQLAAEYGVEMVQFDEDLLSQIGFVPEEDMYNKGHMNVYGSEKVSAYLAEFIREHYDVTRFPEGERDLWDEYLRQYEKAYEEYAQ